MVDFYTGSVTSFIPVKGYAVILTGIALVAASLSIMTKKFMQLASMLLAVLLLIFIATIHIPGLFDEEGWRMALIMLLKDMSLMGGAILIAGSADETQNQATTK
jgi:putative oxidoreductase